MQFSKHPQRRMCTVDTRNHLCTYHHQQLLEDPFDFTTPYPSTNKFENRMYSNENIHRRENGSKNENKYTESIAVQRNC